MILNSVQKLTIQQLPLDELYTIGGVVAGEEKRFEVQRVSGCEYKVSIFALMICLGVDYLKSPQEVIQYIERN